MGNVGVKTLLASLLLTSCAGEFTPEEALVTIASQSEFTDSFCAPLHIGREVLTAENHKDPKAYVESKYGVLVRAGLVKAEIGEKNSWRTVINVTLTDEGRKMVNQKRTDEHCKVTGEDHVFYVAACRLAPEKMIKVDTVSSDTLRIDYLIVERDITPFGEFLGFVDGRSHPHQRTFAKGTFSWDLQKL